MSGFKWVSKRSYGLMVIALALRLVYGSFVFAGEAYYAYDDLSRLTAVVDDAGNTAIYNYDAVGNLLGIDRFTPGASGIGIYAVLPGKGAVGAQVKIQGYGFDPTPSNNMVTFNSTSATVVSSTAYAIIVTVPASATTGTVAVTNTNGSANSPQAFTILGAPTISSITPSTVGQGTKLPITIGGTGLFQATDVTFSHTGLSAIIKTGVTDTSLPLALNVASTVPPGTYTFTVTTPLGTANSGSVTVTVGTPTWGFVHATSHVSVWIPKGTVSGASAAVAPSTSEFPPASQLAPTGPSFGAAPPVSELVP
ncbi:MAG: IPT/TIG domain-containing protein [Nitrospira sp.]